MVEGDFQTAVVEGHRLVVEGHQVEVHQRQVVVVVQVLIRQDLRLAPWVRCENVVVVQRVVEVVQRIVVVVQRIVVVQRVEVVLVQRVEVVLVQRIVEVLVQRKVVRRDLVVVGRDFEADRRENSVVQRRSLHALGRGG